MGDYTTPEALLRYNRLMASSRIVLFLSSLEGGGAERVMVTLANAFVRRGHEVSVVLIFPRHTYKNELDPNVELVDLNAPRLAVGGVRFARFLRARRPDAVLSTLTRINGWAVIAHRLARSRARLGVREATTPTLDIARARTRKERLNQQVIAFLYPKADVVVAPSRGVAQDILRFAPRASGRVHVVYNPIVDESLYRRSEEPVAHTWFTSKTVPVVLAVGRLIWDKGFDMLMQAFAKVRAVMEAHLVILGEGEERTHLEGLVNQLRLTDSVWMPGFEINPFRYMRRADVFVLSSRREGLPNALIQAMACGCPVVSTNCPSGPEEILDGGRYGELVPVDDVEALADAIVRVLQGNRKHVPEEWLAQFEVEHIADQYLNLLLEG